ncbi:class I SAM-dependent methyltransferase [Amylibacter sp.]|nr:class I SAM-dependent methyltransferase [Amylibacter sp.]
MMDCKICYTNDTVDVDSYKHKVVLCNNCNGVSNYKKKGRYILELLGLHLILGFLPRRAYQRLFHAKPDFVASKFYDTYVIEHGNESELRQAEVKQVLSQIKHLGHDIKKSKILDVSGGPGLVGKLLTEAGADVIVTEYSSESVVSMLKEYNLKAIEFDYSKDRLPQLLEEKFDIVLLRSSIIFCDHLDQLFKDIAEITTEDASIILETITPSLGEVFWWQQMEFKFPIIYSEETILKLAFKNNFFLDFGYREKGGYLSNKLRANKGFAYLFWSLFIDLPMVAIYRLKCCLKNIPIDSTLNHKMLTLGMKKHKKESGQVKIFDAPSPVTTHFNITNKNINDLLK